MNEIGTKFENGSVDEMKEHFLTACRVTVVSPSGATVRKFERTADSKHWAVRGLDAKPLSTFSFSMLLRRWLKQGFSVTIYDNVLNQVWTNGSVTK